uniref:Reverse transcriptase domain-containing protein n=1 Tax=Tanacetum cinerariifolium TaxID=118510 RepID=A0A699GVF1_TANCI|nr:hypothetical protein [Tanacetum cinerariifolium]
MEEMLYKFIDEGKREHEEMRAFIDEFRTTNELLFKERNNSLSELRFEVHELLRVIDNALILNYEGASISLMPYTMYEKLSIGEPKPTRMRLELADRETILATARAMIDVFNKKITLRVGDDEVIFDVDQLIKRPPNEADECYGIDDLDDTINMETQKLLANDKSDSFLLKGLEKSINHSDLESCESLGNKSDDDSDLEKPI